MRSARKAVPPRLAHETMLQKEPLRTAVDALVRRLAVPADEPPKLVGEQDLENCPEVNEMLLSRYTVCRQAFGFSHEESLLDAEQLLTHTQCAANFELAGRKAFWVSPELGEQLLNTAAANDGFFTYLSMTLHLFLLTDADVARVLGGLGVSRLAHTTAPGRRWRDASIHRELLVILLGLALTGVWLVCSLSGALVHFSLERRLQSALAPL